MPEVKVACKRCGKKAKYRSKGLCNTCYNREYYHAHPEQRAKKGAYEHAKYFQNPEERRERANRLNRELKQEMIQAYGGKCLCCGETAFEFLSLDHIDGERPKEWPRGGHQLYRRLRKLGWPKDGLRLLCMNCNTAIGFYGHCPHEQENDNA